MDKIELSIVTPVYNEIESLPAFCQSLRNALKDYAHEILFVDDGSTDGSREFLEEECRKGTGFSVICLARNFGQTAALAAGIDAASGEIIVCMDSDGQNNPADVPRLVAEIKNGADVVSGWRHPRQDPFLTRRLPSQIANWMISTVTGVPLHDYGCTLKAYKRNILQDIRLYGEMHRLIPAWCAWRGAKIREVQVHHERRRHGKSKYGMGRIFKVVLDLFTTKFFSSYLTKPSYIFGGVGFAFLFLGFLAGLFPIIDKFVLNMWGNLRVPFIILSVFFGILGVQFVVLGLFAEILVRIYYETKNDRPYRITRTVTNRSNTPEGASVRR